LFGKTVVVQQSPPRNILVSFSATRAGTFHATLEIIFSDGTRLNNQTFSVIRELRGHAVLPEGLGGSSDTGVNESIGINVSHEAGFQFSVERFGPNGPFAMQNMELVFTKSSVAQMVSFKGSRIYSPNGLVDA
jgi:hypothetical protein